MFKNRKIACLGGDETFYPMAEFGDFYFPATNLLLSDGDPVEAWQCAITGLNLTQSNADNRPLYVSDSFGNPAIQGDAANDFLVAVSAEIALIGPSADTDYSLVVVSSSFGTTDRAFAATGNASNTRRLAATARNAGQYRYQWATSGGSVTIANGTARPEAKSIVSTSVSAGTLRQESTTFLPTTVSVTEGDWECDRLTVCSLTNGTAPTNAFIHAILVAKGAKALAIYNDPSALFAASTAEWGTP